MPLSLPPYQYCTGQGLFSGYQGNGHLPLFTLQFYWPSAVNCNPTDNTKVKTNATFLLEAFTFIYLVFFNCNIQNDLHSCTDNTIKHRTWTELSMYMHVKHIEREFEKNNDSIHRVITLQMQSIYTGN